MKAIIEFNLPEDRHEFQLATKATELSIIIDKIRNKLRSDIKYNEKISEETTEYAEKIREELNDLMIEYGIVDD